VEGFSDIADVETVLPLRRHRLFSTRRQLDLGAPDLE
jgi:hypothetical protein